MHTTDDSTTVSPFGVRWPSHRILLIAVAGATVVGGMFGVQRLVLRYARDLPLDVVATVGVQLVPWYVWAALLPGLVMLAERLPLDAGRRGARLSLLLVLGFAAAAVHTALCVFPIGWLTDWTVVNRPVFVGFTQLLVNRGVAAWTEYVLLIAVVQGAMIAARLRERERTAAALAAQLTDAELRALRMQLEPHFLFNTLNAIHAHVRSAPALAEEMLGHLGSVLRAVLSTNAAPERTLRDELTLVRDLLRIHEVRFGARLQVVVESTMEADRAIVPSLLLQPLVENAIVHGASRRPGPVAVHVTATVEGGRLRVAVEDSGSAHLPAAGTESGHRIGLANTRQRLQHHFGSDAMLHLDAQEERTQVTLVVPYRTGAAEA